MYKIRGKSASFIIVLIISLALIPISQVQAVGPFEQVCPKCNGTGQITNTTNVLFLGVGIIALIAASSTGAFMLHKKKTAH
jgi:hypothetical protein